MRNIRLFVLLPIVFFSGKVFVACEKQEDIKRIYPVTITDEKTVNFFSTALPKFSVATCFFTSTDSNCYVINSMEDFRGSFSCNDSLPEIDFTSYTLIIGQKEMPNSYYSIHEQYIVESKEMKLNVYVTLPENHWPAFSKLYYWGVYPKLTDKRISVNITEKRLL